MAMLDLSGFSHFLLSKRNGHNEQLVYISMILHNRHAIQAAVVVVSEIELLLLCYLLQIILRIC